MPGSLGVEAILQAMQTFVLQQGLAADIKQPQFEQLASHTTVWKYRGQILLDVKMMQLEVHIKTIEKQGEELYVIGDAYLWRDGMRIYQLTEVVEVLRYNRQWRQLKHRLPLSLLVPSRPLCP